ncbi:hypothetical protein L1D15_21530 [Vibrio sp. Isolate25]|uniref:hypothetical protein n=1 Tax=Vibrio sp. Isolate25 TaxID=2908535 RepID=UPI001EFC665E|nr:hypothetical protein [Vibrio sp. Isolate25]MCG9599275.1 hypothetical protein [Vibrio sp. Isolate25]
MDCKQLLLYSPSRCHHCGAYQNIVKRGLIFSAPVIASISAAVALLVAIWPYYVDAFVEKRAELYVEILSLNEGNEGVAELLVRNDGRKSGVIDRLVFSAENTDETVCEVLEFKISKERVIKPYEETIVVTDASSSLPRFPLLPPITETQKENASYCKVGIVAISKSTDVYISNSEFYCEM